MHTHSSYAMLEQAAPAYRRVLHQTVPLGMMVMLCVALAATTGYLLTGGPNPQPSPKSAADQATLAPGPNPSLSDPDPAAPDLVPPTPITLLAVRVEHRGTSRNGAA